MKLGALLCVVTVSASCTYVEATSKAYTGVEQFMPVSPAAVRILPGEPKERHDRLGEVFLNVSVDPPPPSEEVGQRLREEAAKLGANGVYIAQDSTTSRDGHKIVGIAIRFRQ
jgi:hypothetical protein